MVRVALAAGDLGTATFLSFRDEGGLPRLLREGDTRLEARFISAFNLLDSCSDKIGCLAIAQHVP